MSGAVNYTHAAACSHMKRGAREDEEDISFHRMEESLDRRWISSLDTFMLEFCRRGIARYHKHPAQSPSRP
jgi:hypothetical protein